MWVSVQPHSSTAVTPEKNLGTHRVGLKVGVNVLKEEINL
jgi:hypothetical protein